MLLPRGLRLVKQAATTCHRYGSARLSSTQAPKPPASPVSFLLNEVGASLRIFLGLGFGVGGTAVLYGAYRESSDPPAPGALVDVQPWYVVEPEDPEAAATATATAATSAGATAATNRQKTRPKNDAKQWSKTKLLKIDVLIFCREGGGSSRMFCFRRTIQDDFMQCAYILFETSCIRNF